MKKRVIEAEENDSDIALLEQLQALRAALVEMRDSIGELAENVEPESSSTDTSVAAATESEPAPKKKRAPRRKLIGEEGVVENPLFPFYEQVLF